MAVKDVIERRRLFKMFRQFTNHTQKRKKDTKSDEALTLANELLDGKDPNTLNKKEIEIAIKGVNYIRHQAIVRNNKKLIVETDTLLRNLETQKQKNLTPKKTIPLPAHLTPTNSDRHRLEPIVDALTEGYEVDTIDLNVIPKLRVILKERRECAVQNGNYEVAKILTSHINSLNEIQTIKISAPSDLFLQSQPTEYDKAEAKIKNAEKSLRRAENALFNLEATYEQESENYTEQREISQSNIFQALEDFIDDIEVEYQELEMGKGFKASKRLLNMRFQQKRLLKGAFFDEAERLKKDADKLEAEERKEFDEKTRKALEAKEMKFKRMCELKIKQSNQIWDKKMEELKQKNEKEIKTIENEIEALKEQIQRLREIQKEYEEMYDEEEEEFFENGEFVEEEEFFGEEEEFIE
ncbi:erythrocyte binding protein [Histomonas meleagridis]|uniref:erythrocyte binding protein n=1 Tax=Histomonas meleagridis TaxID=135588 RepID=UPI00355A6C8B|nr:erythrocyte binding protein [Histomonas meleagridis]KAH0805710.1 erythrocyte binding protein [Histomonas meleagridis]